MSKGPLRGVMPLTAELVDDLRKLLGQEKADRLIAAGKAGRPVFYAAEVGPDGVLREFGSSPSGQRPVACASAAGAGWALPATSAVWRWAGFTGAEADWAGTPGRSRSNH